MLFASSEKVRGKEEPKSRWVLWPCSFSPSSLQDQGGTGFSAQGGSRDVSAPRERTPPPPNHCCR